MKVPVATLVRRRVEPVQAMPRDVAVPERLLAGQPHRPFAEQRRRGDGDANGEIGIAHGRADRFARLRRPVFAAEQTAHGFGVKLKAVIF